MKIIFGILSAFLLFSTGCAVRQYKVINHELHLYLDGKKAEKVYLLTSLDEFKPHKAVKTDSGDWEAVMPSDMEFRYFFLIDGNVFIPDCEMKEKDDFGSEDCVYIPLLGMP